MKTRRGRSALSLWCKLSLPLVSVCCTIFFWTGFYCSSFFFQESAGNKQLLLIDGVTDSKLVSEHGNSGDAAFSTLPFQVLSWKPRALLFRNFASKKECEAIVKLARSRLTPSALALRKGETADSTKEIRTSSGTFLRASEDRSRSLEAVEERMARATMVPRENGEAFNVLRYELGQKYNCHYDVFDPAEYGPQKSQRMASFLLYLSDVEEGGETMFPFELQVARAAGIAAAPCMFSDRNYENMEISYDYKECIGLKVKPSQGDALLFYSMLPNGTFDKTALHGSCPVIKGEKWVATKWIRDTPIF